MVKTLEQTFRASGQVVRELEQTIRELEKLLAIR